MIHVHRIQGDSMLPALAEGDFVITWKLAPKRYKKGDVVVVEHPLYGRVIKRIHVANADDYIKLTGDNPKSLSDRALGWVSRQSILGKVCLRFAAPGMKKARV